MTTIVSSLTRTSSSRTRQIVGEWLTNTRTRAAHPRGEVSLQPSNRLSGGKRIRHTTVTRALTWIFAATVLALTANSVSESRHLFNLTGTPGNWSTVSNWDNGKPTGTSSGYIVNGGTASITSAGETCYTLSLGGTGTGTVKMTDGSLKTSRVIVGDSNTGTLAAVGWNQRFQATFIWATAPVPTEHTVCQRKRRVVGRKRVRGLFGHRHLQPVWGNQRDFQQPLSRATTRCQRHLQPQRTDRCQPSTSTWVTRAPARSRSWAEPIRFPEPLSRVNAGASGTYNLSGTGQLSGSNGTLVTRAPARSRNLPAATRFPVVLLWATA